MRGCIYKITNCENGKFYIGQTTKHPIARFGRHITSAYEKPNNDLHRDILKYGYEKFKIEILEENIKKEKLNEKEQFYIDKMKPIYNNYTVIDKVNDKRKKEVLELKKQGNSIIEISKKTKIGQISVMKILHEYGIRKRNSINEEEVLNLYSQGMSSNEISRKLEVSSSAITRILNKNNVKMRGVSKPVIMLSVDGEKLKSFESGRKAGIYIAENKNYKNIENCYKNINACCRGKKKTAYGYRWIFK
jgi:group I intron endonuclease